MIVILAEKPDVGSKIAAALDRITLASGKTITSSQLADYEKQVKAQQQKDGYLQIRFMGQECFVTWGRGHLCQLKQAKDYDPAYQRWSLIPLPFIPQNYEIMLRPGRNPADDASTKRQFEIVKRLLRKADLVVNATDYDREGEVIFSYIYELTGCKAPVKRACFSSMQPSAFVEAFSKLRDRSEFLNIDAAGRMRGIADWLVGANLTVAMSLKNPGQGIFSVGRVQTPTLALVVNRELEIRDFKPKPYWTLEAEFSTSGQTYKGKHNGDRFLVKADADAILRKIDGKDGVVTKLEKKRTFREGPPLYSLHNLQADTNSMFGLTLGDTLEIAQKLYDAGYTTYPRTDSQYLTDDMEPAVNRVLDMLATIPGYDAMVNGRPRKFNRKKYFDSTKVTSHYAIIPTDTRPKALSGMEAKVYDLICRSVIRMLYGPAELEKTEVITTVEGEEFLTSGSIIVDPGWMATDIGKKREEILPDLHEGDICAGKYSLNEKKTEPPKRYTDKTLLATMLSAGKALTDADLRKILSDPKHTGIGTEATRASIVKTLEDNAYIARDGKAIKATEKGIAIIQKLPIEIVKSAELTARWEQRLNDIADGKETPLAFQSDIENAVKEWISEIDSKVKISASLSGAAGAVLSGAKCPVCNNPIEVKKWGYGCAGWRTGCKFSIGTICGKHITENQAKILLDKGKSPLIKGFVSKSGKKFDAFLVINAGKVEFEFPPSPKK